MIKTLLISSYVILATGILKPDVLLIFFSLVIILILTEAENKIKYKNKL